MLTRQEYNELYKRIEALTDAWETYVKSVAVNISDRYGNGVAVTDCKEDLLRYLKDIS
jgi:hypothetical protein